jgi:hypothetical protein
MVPPPKPTANHRKKRDMKLTTIWSIRGMEFAERLRRTREAAIRSIAHRLPRRLAYWSFIATGVRHIKSDEIVPDVRFTDLLQRVGAAQTK